jgi:hypothetical protein
MKENRYKLLRLNLTAEFADRDRTVTHELALADGKVVVFDPHRYGRGNPGIMDEAFGSFVRGPSYEQVTKALETVAFTAEHMKRSIFEAHYAPELYQPRPTFP